MILLGILEEEFSFWDTKTPISHGETFSYVSITNPSAKIKRSANLRCFLYLKKYIRNKIINVGEKFKILYTCLN